MGAKSAIRFVRPFTISVSGNFTVFLIILYLFGTDAVIAPFLAIVSLVLYLVVVVEPSFTDGMLINVD